MGIWLLTICITALVLFVELIMILMDLDPHVAVRLNAVALASWRILMLNHYEDWQDCRWCKCPPDYRCDCYCHMRR